ncbi:hypothetical protein GCM10028803_50340 [Larkinella knui]
MRTILNLSDNSNCKLIIGCRTQQEHETFLSTIRALNGYSKLFSGYPYNYAVWVVVFPDKQSAVNSKIVVDNAFESKIAWSY